MRWFIVSLGLLLCLAGRCHAVSVTAYGAHGADLIDDTAAIQAAINANSIIDFPSGTYYISARLQIPGNRLLRGVLNNPASVYIRIVGAINGLDIGGAANITVEDLTLDRVSPGTGNYAVTNGNGSDIAIRRIHILDNRSVRSAIIISNSTSVTVENCFVRNYQTYDTTTSQVNGQGIRFSDVVDGRIRHNIVIEYQNLIPPGPTSNFYQSGGIEISGSRQTIVEYNTIVTTGNGIDAGTAAFSIMRYNTIRNCHEVGVKLVNQSHDDQVYGNVIDKCGLANVRISPGAPSSLQGASYNNIIRENILTGTGLGIAENYWSTSNGPSAIWIDGSPDNPAHPSHHNTITGNVIFASREKLYDIQEVPDINPPYANSISANTVLPPRLDDYGFFRPGSALWRAVSNTGGSPPDIDGTSGDFVISGVFGNFTSTDVALVGDVNGDGAADRVICNTATWLWTWDSAPYAGVTVTPGFGDGTAERPASAFGQGGDVPLLGDVDGDGAADRILYRPSTQAWLVDFSLIPVYPYTPALHGFGDGLPESLGGTATYDAGGATLTKALAGDYDGNGIADRVIYSAGVFHTTPGAGGGSWGPIADSTIGIGLGNASFIPPPFLGDFDGDGKSDNIAWNGIGNSGLFSRLSTTTPAWGEPPTVAGTHYGDPNLDIQPFVADFNAPPLVVPVELAHFGLE